MKSLFKTLLIATVLVSAAACNNRVEPAAPGKDATFTATREALAPVSKSVLQDGGSVLWSASEEISVFCGSGSAGGDKFTSTNITDAATVEFSGTLSVVGADSDYWAVYPYSADNACDGSSITTVIPDQQVAVEGNFSGGVFPAMAKSSSMSFAFWNLCGGVKFSVTRNDIKSVNIKGNNGEALAGTVKFAFDGDGKPVVSSVVDAKADVTITAPGGGTFEPGKFYYVTLLPCDLTTGLWLTFTTDTAEGVFFSDKAQTVKRSVFGVIANADAYVTSWDSSAPSVTIKDFAEELITILDVWENTTGTIDMLKGEDYTGGEWNVENAHYVPDATTITVGGKDYNTADMFETALRSYLLVRGYNGLETEKYGKNSIDALAGGAQAMSTTAVPETHGYYWGTSPYNETPGNGGHFVMGTKDSNEPCKVMLDALDNWAMRSLNYQHGQAITNLCGYAGGQLAGYYGCFCSKRALLTYAFFFKYMLDNKLDTADGIAADTIFRTELFGDEGKQDKPIELKAQWLFSAARMAPVSEGGDGYKDTFGLGSDPNPGDGGAYVNSVIGNGKLTWVQGDKTSFPADKQPNAARKVGSTGHPYITGLWYDDYWLFEVTSDVELPAGTKIHIKYIARSSSAGAKFWMGEYYDAGEWKIAPMEVIEPDYNFATPVETTLTDRDGNPETFSYNIKMKEDGDHNTTIESYFVLTAPTTKIQYRQIVTGLYQSKNGTTSIGGLGTATTRIAGSDYKDGVSSSPLIEVVNE
jgi:hypothetical protein